MQRNFYKLLIIGNPHPTIPHIPTRNNGMVEKYKLPGTIPGTIPVKHAYAFPCQQNKPEAVMLPLPPMNRDSCDSLHLHDKGL